jgi:hypothetical protein
LTSPKQANHFEKILAKQRVVWILNRCMLALQSLVDSYSRLQKAELRMLQL